VRGKVCWERNVKCGEGVINIHITEDKQRKVSGVEGNFNFIIPNRIGIDFHNFREESYDYIPNVSLSDIVQLINRLHLLGSETVRKALLARVIPHRFGVEFDFRRKLDFDVKVYGTKDEQIEMYYEDPKRFERFMICCIEPESLPPLEHALKECVVEYTYLTNKLLLL